MSVEAQADAGTAQTQPPQSKGGSSLRWLLVVCCVAQFMVILDLSIVNVALPSIQSDLGFSSPDLQWVVDAYAITFAGFLMLGGRAADHFGQRRTLVAGLVLFGLASLAGGDGARPGRADRRARDPGPRRCADGCDLAGDHHRRRSRRARSCIARSVSGRR